MLTVCVTEANLVSTKYRKLESAQNITVTKRVEVTARSAIDCSRM